MTIGRGRRGFAWLTLAYVALIALCAGTFLADGDLTIGRNPWRNLLRSVGEFSHPSFVDIWFGDPHREYRSDDGRLLRVEDRRVVERRFVAGLAEAAWTTLRIATLGSLLGALLGLPFGLVSARNVRAPVPAAWIARSVLNASRSIHTLVFGLVLVGIVGLGPTAGILAIALHSLGTYGKLYAEAIEVLDFSAVDAVRATGARPSQVFFSAILPAVLPQVVSSHLYIWEFNIRDSTILGLIGAGGLGLLISEAVSLFQWSRLATILIVVVALVTTFDVASSRIRRALL